MIWLPKDCGRPALRDLDRFWQECKLALPDTALPDSYQVRWIGLDDATTEEVIELIVAGDKTGTFTLPWLIERTGQAVPALGDAIILIDFAGHPRLLVRLTKIHEVAFAAVSAADTQIDGSPVRDLAIWKPLHTGCWNGLLAPFEMSVTDDMPVLIEAFDLLYAGSD